MTIWMEKQEKKTECIFPLYLHLVSTVPHESWMSSIEAKAGRFGSAFKKLF